FAANEVEIDGLNINCELRSVNHRYLDITLKLPERLRYTEAEVRGLIAAKVNRGRIECAINTKKQSNNQIFNINEEAVAALLSATRQIEQAMDAALSFSALDVLAFPGIQQEPEWNKTKLTQEINDLVTNTVAQLSATREREGRQLKSLIEERCKKINALVATAQQRLPDVLTNLRAKLTARIHEISAQPDLDRLEQELVYHAQKLDIAEELDRLATHSNEVTRLLSLSEPVGRQLDFLMQELNREANTLGSKASDKDMTQISIELKVLIEQIREQVQNIE
ncbi:partial hypothetical protein, partial [biofilm metagenome]